MKKKSSSKKNNLKYVLSKINNIWGILLLIISWSIISSTFPNYIMPSIKDIWFSIINTIYNGDVWGIIFPTIKKVFVGFFFSLFIGIIIGILFANVIWMKKTLHPIIIVIQAAPPISWIVFAILWAGTGFIPPVLVQFFTCLPIIVISMYHGIEYIDEKYKNVVKIYNISFLDNVRYILFPASLPSILSGIRICLGLSWRIVVTTEFFASNTGIGYYISWSYSNMNTDLTIAYTIFVVILALLSEYLIIMPIERMVNKWIKF